ncbi:hypothetical protein [Burkholderia sp. Ac-20379]|uniref:hypothetical protein n=1 Tax=Burkholderia sp. Ac-20379 TaxID=2703900 RepID=UPI00198248FB|nr:hypothetical protein [Burkholderia sp. Ac-20379]MBN3724369.1 hypothetical protein [Burkholderia sp. Ac-20379]
MRISASRAHRTRSALARRAGWHGLSRPAAALAIVASLLAAGCAEPSAHAQADTNGTAPKLDRDKAAQLQREQQIARTVPSLGSIHLAQPRPVTLRDSGQNGAITMLRDVDFRIVGDLGFYVHQLSATLVPSRAGAPIVFDDPATFSIAVHRGIVTLDDTKLTAVFNNYLFGYRNAPLRKLKVSAGDGTIHLEGEMQRGGWVPFSLTGTLSVRDGSQLVFHPSTVRVQGLDANPVMRAANVKLADLLKIDTPVAKLTGDDLVMQVDKLMPPPQLKLTVAALRITPAGLDLAFDDGTHAGFAMPDGAPQQAMLIRGGDVKFMRSMPMNADILIAPAQPAARTAPFVFDLYHYRDQVSTGYFNFAPSGAMTIRIPSYTGAKPPANAIGSASARLNDSFAEAQQAALRDARQRWFSDALAGGGSAAAPSAVNAAPADERHVSNKITSIQLRNVDFTISGNIGFHVDRLDAQMVPRRAGEPVDLDDPNQYDIKILGGSVLEPWPAMNALFNDYLLDYTPRALNDLKLAPDGTNLRVTGGIRLWNHVPPGVWLPTSMSGTIGVLDGRHIAYTPTQVSVLGVPQAKLLHALGIELASLTPLRRRGAELRGDALVLDQYTVFPPPVLKGQLAQASVEPNGLRLTFNRAPDAPALPKPGTGAASYIWMEGGDMKMFNVLETNLRALIENTAQQGPMQFDLYGYRAQVSKGSVRMAADGTLLVDLGKANPLAP